VKLEISDPQPGEVLVRVVGAGMCHTDLLARTPGAPFPLPVVLGHEGSGIVEAVGAGVTFGSSWRQSGDVVCELWKMHKLLDGLSSILRSFLPIEFHGNTHGWFHSSYFA